MIGRRSLGAGVLAALLVVLGCSNDRSAPTDRSTQPSAPTVQTTPDGGSDPTTAPPRRPTTVTLAFAGDLNFDQQLAGLLTAPLPLVSALSPLLAEADVAMLNLETSITERGSPEPKAYHFRAPPSALSVVASTGLDVVTMANNHAVDYGPVGFADTLAAKAASPIPVVGIGHDAAEAFAPAVLHRAGLSIAVLGSTEIDDLTLNAFPATVGSPGVATNLDPRRLLVAVRAAAARYELVVVYLHWGLDYTSCPDAIQPAMAARLAAAGADIIVGSHAHRVQAGGWQSGAYVDYGLGNFAWARNDGDNGVSGVLTLTVDVAAAEGRGTGGPVVRRARWTPLLIGDDGIPRRPDPATRGELSARWLAARDCADLGARPG